MTPLLTVTGLRVSFPAQPEPVRAVRGMDLHLEPGERVGLVGASGAGKSVLARALLGLLPPHADISGDARFRGRPLLRAGRREMRRIRGLAMVFQEPSAALNPLRTVGSLLEEVSVAACADPATRRARGRRALQRVGLDDLDRMLRSHPGELSGGQRQRVMIALAIVNEPQVILADEPTTALDATARATVLATLRQVSDELGAALLLISHDLAVVAAHTQRTLVAHDGRIVEEGPTPQLFAHPRTAHTQALLAAHPTLGRTAPPPARAARPASHRPLLQVRDVTQVHRGPGLRRRAPVTAVRGVSLDVAAAECVGLVGASGSGKSSLARAVLRLDGPTSGTVRLDGVDLARLTGPELRRARARMQYVPQDPGGSLNPRWTVAASLTEPMRVHRRPHDAGTVHRALRQVGLAPDLAGRLPHELSGGQRQRVAIARALILRPGLLVLDEPLTALDCIAQAGVLRLLARLNRDLAVAILVIGHDLGALQHLCDRLVVMHDGRIVEDGPAHRIVAAPRHRHTRELVAATPGPWTPTGPHRPD